MSNRKRYKDREQAKKITGVPSETRKGFGSWKKRHRKRLEVALINRADAEKWVAQNGWSMTIKNSGHHWTIQTDRFVVEWWPSSAKLVFDKKYKNGIHTHSWSQVQALIAKRIEVKP